MDVGTDRKTFNQRWFKLPFLLKHIKHYVNFVTAKSNGGKRIARTLFEEKPSFIKGEDDGFFYLSDASNFLSKAQKIIDVVLLRSCDNAAQVHKKPFPAFFLHPFFQKILPKDAHGD